jgi:sugar lactone lactonase YvrE
VAQQAPEPEWRQARAAMRKACAAKEWDACVAATERAAAATSGNADLVYNLAAIEALRGHREAAFTGLARYAALGLGLDAAADADFASLEGDPRFAALLETLAQHRASTGTLAEVARLAPADLLAEDVVRDPAGKAFYVSSVHTRQVLALPDGGPARPLLAPAPGLFGMFALGLDAARGRLWVATAAVPEAQGLAQGDAGRTALLSVSLADGRVLERFDLAAPGARHALGDLTVGPDGAVYASDGFGGVVYRLAPGGAALEPLVGRDELHSPQTPALEAKSNTLYVPDYLRGLARVDLATRAVRWVAHGDDVALSGSTASICAPRAS